jgi:organic radical activating enzyme
VIDYLTHKSFCIAPFAHCCIWTDGRAIPCCINQDFVFGDTKTQSIKEIYSDKNTRLIEFRKEILSGTPPESCHRCTKPEEELGADSYRHFLNKRYGHRLSEIGIRPDGTVEKFTPIYLDVRLSNLCNLRCRMCDHINSSAIAAEENNFLGKSNSNLQQPFEDFGDFSHFLENNLESIEHIYFCGGEPMLMDYHYKILDILIKYNKRHIHLKYNSNCTKIEFRGKPISEYWKHFDNVCLGMSLDDLGARGEYIRDGSKWEKIIHNLKTIRKECPHVWLEWTPTVQILNISYIPELHRFLFENNLIDEWFYIILTSPDFYSIQTLPKKIKALVSENLNNYKLFIDKTSSNTQHHLRLIDELIKYMNLSDESHKLSILKSEILQKDLWRNQTFSSIYPELRFIMET